MPSGDCRTHGPVLSLDTGIPPSSQDEDMSLEDMDRLLPPAQHKPPLFDMLSGTGK